jgi:capsular polysaccharide transport system ATP-binding protein
MIAFEAVSKSYRVNGVDTMILDRVSLNLPPRRAIGLLGRNGAGKSTLLRLIAGTEAPSAGKIRTSGRISWPVGFAGSFHPDLTGAENARFVARLYGVDSDALVTFAERFCELGAQFRWPCRTYSSGMIARLAFGLSMGVGFDLYLVDEVTSVGDEAFRTKSAALFRERMAGAGAILVNHTADAIRQLCDAALVLDRGRLAYFEDVEAALSLHRQNQARGP